MHDSRRRIALVVAIVLLQLFAVYLLVKHLQDRLGTELANNAEISLNFLADGVTGRTQRFIKPAEDAVQTAVELAGAALLDTNNDDALTAFFTAELHATDWLSGMLLGRSDGSFVMVSRNEIGLRTKLINNDGEKRSVRFIQHDSSGAEVETWVDSEDHYDPRERPWFKAASPESDLAWTSPYTFYSTGLPGMTVASSLPSGGVIAVDVDLAQLSEFVSVNPHTEDGVAIIASLDDRVIAHSNTTFETTATEPDGLHRVDQIKNAPLKALLAYSQQIDSTTSASGNTVSFSATETGDKDDLNQPLIHLDVDDTAYLGLVRPFSLSEGRINWSLLVKIPAKDYSAGTLLLLDRGIAILGALSLALGALTLLGVYWLHLSSKQSLAASERDPVTGVLLQTAFEKRVYGTLLPGVFRQHKHSHAIMIIEMRHLRHLIDRSGQAAGTRVLEKTASCINSLLQTDDLLGRSYQSRFLVYLFDRDEAVLLERIHKLHELVVELLQAQRGDSKNVIQVASGAALFEKGEPAANLMQRAREATAIGIEIGDSNCHIADRFHGGPAVDLDVAA